MFPGKNGSLNNVLTIKKAKLNMIKAHSK